MSVSEFVISDKHLTLLAECSKLEFDTRSQVFVRHPLTTEEIRLLCEDVKVLGPTELRQLVSQCFLHNMYVCMYVCMYVYPRCKQFVVCIYILQNGTSGEICQVWVTYSILHGICK